jgi:hypothetical protein
LEPLVITSNQELDLKVKSNGKFRLGIRFIDNGLTALDKVYIKYHDLTKRKLA